MKTTKATIKNLINRRVKSLKTHVHPNYHTYTIKGLSRKYVMGDSWDTVLIENRYDLAEYKSTLAIPLDSFDEWFKAI